LSRTCLFQARPWILHSIRDKGLLLFQINFSECTRRLKPNRDDKLARKSPDRSQCESGFCKVRIGSQLLLFCLHDTTIMSMLGRLTVVACYDPETRARAPRA